MVDINLTGVFLCTRAAFRHDEGADAARRPHHQQRLDLGARAAAELHAYTATKHAITGLTKSISLDGREYDIACGQIDIGNAATEMAARMARGVPQANGEIAVEPMMDVEQVADAVLIWRACRWTRTCSS